MEAVHPPSGHVILRAAITLVGAVMLFTAPVTALGILVMFIGLVCAVGGLTLEKTTHF